MSRPSGRAVRATVCALVLCLALYLALYNLYVNLLAGMLQMRAYSGETITPVLAETPHTNVGTSAHVSQSSTATAAVPWMPASTSPIAVAWSKELTEEIWPTKLTWYPAAGRPIHLRYEGNTVFIRAQPAVSVALEVED